MHVAKTESIRAPVTGSCGRSVRNVCDFAHHALIELLLAHRTRIASSLAQSPDNAGLAFRIALLYPCLFAEEPFLHAHVRNEGFPVRDKCDGGSSLILPDR